MPDGKGHPIAPGASDKPHPSVRDHELAQRRRRVRVKRVVRTHRVMDDPALLPDVFEEVAGNIGLIRAFCLKLRAKGIDASHPQVGGPEFSFVRMALAACDHDVAGTQAAIQEVLKSRDGNGRLIAALSLNLLRGSPLRDSGRRGFAARTDRKNLLASSIDLSSPPWLASQLEPVLAGGATPRGDGAWRIIPNSTVQFHSIYQPFDVPDLPKAEPVTASFMAKADGYDVVRIFSLGRDKKPATAMINLIDGQIEAVRPEGSVRAVRVGDGWWQIEQTFHLGDGDQPPFMRIYVHPTMLAEQYAGDGHRGVLLAAPQVERGAQRTGYVATSSTGERAQPPRLLVVQDAADSVRACEEELEEAGGTLLSPSAPDVIPPSRGRVECRFQDVAFWYSAEGRRYHEKLESLGHKVGSLIAATDARLKGLEYSLALYVIDALRAHVWLGYQAYELSRTGDYDAVLIPTKHYHFAALVRELSGDLPVRVKWLGNLDIPKPGNPIGWPRQRMVAEISAHKAGNRITYRGQREALRPRPWASSGDAELGEPALVIWSLKESNYCASLRRIVQEVFKERSAVVILHHGGVADYESAREDVRRLAAQAGRRVRVIHLGGFVKHAAAIEADLAGRMAEALERGSRTLAASDGPDDAVQASFIKHYILPDARVINEFCATARVLTYIDAIFSKTKPAYCIASPSRYSMFSAIVERIDKWGVPTIDVYHYTVGDSARQLPPRAAFMAVVDSQQQAFLSRRWGVDQERILRMGTLGAGLAAVSRDTGRLGGELEDFLARHDQVVLAATQPGSESQVQQFLLAVEAIVDASAGRVGLLIKSHPRESGPALRPYHALAGRLGPGRAMVLEPEIDGRKILRRASLLITRTSNIGIEAAALGIPVLRCPYLEPDLDPAFLELAYAANAGSQAEAMELGAGLLNDASARSALTNRQQGYFELNPGLLEGDGPARVVQYMESWRERVGVFSRINRTLRAVAGRIRAFE